jgi:glyoxylase I family protein
MRVAGLHHVALTVSDLDKSADWYEALFDLDLLFDEDGAARRAKVYRLRQTDAQFGLVEHASTDGDAFAADRIGLDHLAFTVSSRDELDRWYERLVELGVEHSPPVDIPVGAILNFRDPDGIQLAIFWDQG